LRIFFTDGIKKPVEIRNPNAATRASLELHEQAIKERMEKARWHSYLCEQQCKKCDKNEYHICDYHNKFPCPDYISKKHSNNNQLTA